jgi:hypothetical protein
MTDMTEQEAEAWAARLTRIWMPETDWVTQEDWLPQWIIRDRSFTYSTKVAPSIRLTYTSGYSPGTDTLSLYRRQDGKRTGSLFCFIQKAVVEVGLLDIANKHLFDQFDTEWRDSFRRGCWLSGVPIEASAHEKSEWIQGFTNAEIEAWNLKT